jgi:hypothetical protein
MKKFTKFVRKLSDRATGHGRHSGHVPSGLPPENIDPRFDGHLADRSEGTPKVTKMALKAMVGQSKCKIVVENNIICNQNRHS